MKKFGGVITNWQVHHLEVSPKDIEKVYPDSGALPMIFTGTVVRWNPKLRDGYHMRSSLIVAINRECGIVETLNTKYKVINEGNDVFPDLGNKVLEIFY